MRMKVRWYLYAAGVVLLAALIGGTGRPQAAHSAQTGDTPNADTVAAFAKAGCAGCHTIPGVPNASGLVGPDLSNIGNDGATRVSGLDAAGYIQQSILDPNAFIAPECPNGECPSNVMLPNFADRLAESEITLIVDYLALQKGAGAATPTLYQLVPIEIVRPAEASVVAFAEPPREYSDAQVLLGKYLFFDPRISADTSLSCATCHQPDYAFSNSDAFSPGYTGTKYFRNAPTVMNTVFMDYLYWDGRMDGADMPTLVRDHITEAHFMNSDGRLMVERVKQVPEYVQLFDDAFGANPSFGRVLNAITAYVQSLNSGPTPYDEYQAGDTSALSDDAVAGLELFNENCAACHSGPTFSDNKFHNIGVPASDEIWGDPLRHITFRRFFRQLGVPNYRALVDDPGLYALNKLEPDRGAFRTAPLREVGRTAPYMHNGMFATLEQVVTFYNDSADLGFDSEEIGQLVAFLNSLSSEPVPVEVTGQPAYQLRTLGDNR